MLTSEKIIKLITLSLCTNLVGLLQPILININNRKSNDVPYSNEIDNSKNYTIFIKKNTFCLYVKKETNFKLWGLSIIYLEGINLIEILN